MPFSNTFKHHPAYERLRRIRQRPVLAFGGAIGIVAVATAVRWWAGPQLVPGVPFITYYPAIILAVVIGGFWPGVLSILLSAMGAWFLFLPPTENWASEGQVAISLAFFVGISSINLMIVLFFDRALARVIAQEENVRVLIESAPNGIVVVDDQGEITLVNGSTEKLFGYKRDELIGKSVDVLVPDDRVHLHREQRAAYAKNPETRPMGRGRDLSGRRKDGSEFPVEIGLNPIGGNGKKAVLATVIDISAHKKVVENQKFLISELQHRTKNLFAVAMAIANSTLFAGKPVAEARYVFNSRMRALDRAYDLVATATWEGVSLADILNRQFEGFSSRVSMGGCDIPMRVSAAHQFALIIHELTTNALKYGALSTPEGRVSIEGVIEPATGDDRFMFQWLESDGPSVSPPVRKGFGSVIIEDSARQFAKRVTVDYAPNGLRYELRCSLSDIRAPGTTSPRPAEAGCLGQSA